MTDDVGRPVMRFSVGYIRPVMAIEIVPPPPPTMLEAAGMTAMRIAKGAVIGAWLAASVVAASVNPEAFTRGVLIGVLTSRAVQIAR